MASSTTSFLTQSDLDDFVDWNILAELAADEAADGSYTKLTQAQVATDTKISKALKAASGEIESALVHSGRYTVTALNGLAGVAIEFVNQLVARKTVINLYDRRGDRNTVPKPDYYHLVHWQIQQLQYGDLKLQI